MIYTAMCKQFKEQQFERFCKEQKRWFNAPYIGKHSLVYINVDAEGKISLNEIVALNAAEAVAE